MRIFLTVLLISMFLFIPTTTVYAKDTLNYQSVRSISSSQNILICQDYNDNSQNTNKIFTISGDWVADHNTETIYLRINQNGQYFSWLLSYVDQGLTASGSGIINGTVLNTNLNLPGRELPQSGEILNYTNSGIATEIMLEDMNFYRQY